MHARTHPNPRHHHARCVTSHAPALFMMSHERPAGSVDSKCNDDDDVRTRQEAVSLGVVHPPDQPHELRHYVAAAAWQQCWPGSEQRVEISSQQMAQRNSGRRGWRRARRRARRHAAPASPSLAARCRSQPLPPRQDSLPERSLAPCPPVVVGRPEGVLRHRPARRKDDKVGNRGACERWGGREGVGWGGGGAGASAELSGSVQTEGACQRVDSLRVVQQPLLCRGRSRCPAAVRTLASRQSPSQTETCELSPWPPHQGWPRAR